FEQRSQSRIFGVDAKQTIAIDNTCAFRNQFWTSVRNRGLRYGRFNGRGRGGGDWLIRRNLYFRSILNSVWRRRQPDSGKHRMFGIRNQNSFENYIFGLA